MPASNPTQDLNVLFRELPDQITSAIKKGFEEAVNTLSSSGAFGGSPGSGGTSPTASVAKPYIPQWADSRATILTGGGSYATDDGPQMGAPGGGGPAPAQDSHKMSDVEKLGTAAILGGTLLEGGGLAAAAGEGSGGSVLHSITHALPGGALTGAAALTMYNNRKRGAPLSSGIIPTGMPKILGGSGMNLSPMMAAAVATTMLQSPMGQMGQTALFHPNAAVLPGQQAGGASRSGVFGTPFFSSAYAAGLGQDWRAGLASWFGHNPNYSFGQALEAQRTIAASGYWGDDAHFLANQMQLLSQNAQMNPQEVMGLYDPVMRFGGSAAELQAQLNGLAQASKAAHLGLSQFGQDLVQTSQAITQQTGMVAPTGMLQALSAGTRISPSGLSGLGSTQNLVMGAALTGQNFGDLMFSQRSKRVEAAMALPSAIWGGLTGNMSFSQFRHLPAAQQSIIKNRLAYAYASDPNIFGGLSPTQMFDNWAKGIDYNKRMQGFSDVQSAASKGQILQAIHEFGGPGEKSIRASFLADLSKHGVHQAQSDLIKKMSTIMDQNNNKAQQKVTLTLDPWARRLLKFQDGNKANQNSSGNSGWRTAVSIGQDVALTGAGAAIGGVPGAFLGHEASNLISGITGGW